MGRPNKVVLTIEQLKALCTMVEEIKLDLADIAANGIPEPFARSVAYKFSWCALYETNLAVLFARCGHLNSSPIPAAEALSKDDPVHHILTWARNEGAEIEKWEKKQLAAKLAEFALGIVLMRNIQALLLYGRSINGMLEDAIKRNSSKSLFRAISLDQSIISCGPVNKRIRKAVIQQHRDFFDGLGKALKGKTGNPRQYLSSVRVVILILHETGQLRRMSVKERTDLLIGKLRLISDDLNKDTPGTLNQFINRVLKGECRQ